ncbi:DUF1294 domain-containing protein [Microbulbifer hainanensis]|uniref:DUF1294 domain-containing protein n=1 Tax=Microbulbifer hainanensis TaxID=2735675 RepID=UPI001868D1EE|nr:DUF1294 domain-containing protein [Microbulbifer hainanensis]
MRKPISEKLTLLIVFAFIGALGLAIACGFYPREVLWWIMATSFLSLALYAWDKRAAVNGRQRISEATLHFWSVSGGWPGAVLGQQLFRHKTTKRAFRNRFWLTVFVNALLVAWTFTDSGVHLLNLTIDTARDYTDSGIDLLQRL